MISKLGRIILSAVASVWLSGCTATPSHPKATALTFLPQGTRVLFQGDSITDGNRGRNTDPNHILGHGYQFIIASKYGEQLAERQWVFMNRGISGNKVSDLARRWDKDTVELKPDILSILIGVNDLNAGVSAEEYERQYDELLAATQRSLPKTKLVLCEPFGLPVGHYQSNWSTQSLEFAKRRAIVHRLAAKYHAPVVEFQKAFDEATRRAPADYWMWDGVHPTYSGHQLMADEWVRTVEKAWSAK